MKKTKPKKPKARKVKSAKKCSTCGGFGFEIDPHDGWTSLCHKCVVSKEIIEICITEVKKGKPKC